MNRYRIKVFIDGNGDLHYKPEIRYKYWPFYFYFKIYDSEDSYYHLKFHTLEEAEKWVNKLKAEDDKKNGSKLTLVTSYTY